ncbi:uncharacterized protein LDX57_002588 [Aspergillus melleus]|uniref:uncharacterized protein n=1 Tax=Aspergillus melleus TaxID=138277 RepID=UPI001E8EA842|nr:uncharacterized protein LDX57_002588 [Aspergillus melleus]KAH8424845.1 hypothetical protein LDX57_002588 [Aspergillus melleus]
MDHGHATQNELLRHVAEHLITLSQISLVGIDDSVAHSGVESCSSREDSTRDGSPTGSDFFAERLELINETETQYIDEDLPQVSCPPSTESLHWEFVLTQFSQADSKITHDPIIQSIIEHNQRNTPVFHTQYLSNENSHLTAASAQLRQSLIEAEVRVFFQGTEQAFVPVSSRKELITLTAVLEILYELGVTDRASSTGLARVILEESNILFAILIHQNEEGSILKFIEEGIGDDDFPFMMSHDNSALETNDGRNIGFIEDWDNDSIRRLESQQYCHLAPIFHYQQHYELSDGCVFPITEMSAQEDLSTVFKAWIHADHHDFYAVPLSEVR